MTELGIPTEIRRQLNSPERGPWTYFNTPILPDEGKRQQYVVEADKGVAMRLLRDYLITSGRVPDGFPEKYDIETHDTVSIEYVHGGPSNTHVNIMRTDESNERLRVEITDNEQQ